MKDFVSSRRLGIFALVASLLVVLVACSIFISNGFASMGLGWVGLALLAALWVSMRSTRSIAQLLGDVEAEPTLAVAAKSGRLTASKWVHVAWLSLLPVFSFAGMPDPAANDPPSTLTELEIAQAALPPRQRAASNCKNGLPPCDYSELTPTEAREVALAERQRNLSSCRNGWDGCDRSKLSEREAAEGEVAVPTRNMSDCKDGRDSCDYSLLSRSEAQAINSAERVRNYTACLNRRGYCDLSRLTPSEAASIPPEVR